MVHIAPTETHKRLKQSEKMLCNFKKLLNWINVFNVRLPAIATAVDDDDENEKEQAIAVSFFSHASRLFSVDWLLLIADN